jgi:hypothetical protein
MILTIITALRWDRRCAGALTAKPFTSRCERPYDSRGARFQGNQSKEVTPIRFNLCAVTYRPSRVGPIASQRTYERDID